MAQRANTLEYAFATRTTALNAATRHDFSAVTVVIDENTSRTFTSVHIEVAGRGTETASTSITSVLIGVNIDAVGFNDNTLTSTFVNTGDQQSHLFVRDVTSYFNTNYTGTSHSVQVGVQFGGLGMINVTAKLVITYEYDDAAQTTRTKTVRIPIESGTTTLSNTIAEIGTNQVPQLTGVGGFLRESSITVRDIFFEVFANEGHVSGTTDDQLELELDTEGATAFGLLEQALDSSPWMYVIWKRTDMTTGSAHAFRARSTTTGRFPQLGAVLVVTYSYDYDSSSDLTYSVLCHFPTEIGALGGPTSTDQSHSSIVVDVQEPGTVTLLQSGVVACWNAYNSVVSGLNVSVGSQAHRTYTPLTNMGSPAGQQTLVQRIDSGGAAGSALTLARGENELTLGWYRTSTTLGATGSGWYARLILNYAAGKTAGHKRTILRCVGGTAALGTGHVYDYSASAPSIPESSYWVDSIGYQQNVTHAGRGINTLGIERETGEGNADGWITPAPHSINFTNELGVYTPFIDASQYYDRHPGELDENRLGIETSRAHRVSSYYDPTISHGGWTSLIQVITYHSITRTVNGTITGYAGDGSGIVVTAHRADTGEALYQATSTTGGSYTLTAYSDTVSLFAQAREDATHVGRSNNFTPS